MKDMIECKVLPVSLGKHSLYIVHFIRLFLSSVWVLMYLQVILHEAFYCRQTSERWFFYRYSFQQAHLIFLFLDLYT